jgi:ribosomal protein S18 acetylase RimI-like enzyme
MSVQVRPGGAGDVDALLAFLDAIPEGERAFFKEDLDRTSIERWFAGGRGFRALALDGEEVVGYAAVIPQLGWSDHVGEVRLVVEPGHRRSGVGRALARLAVLEAVERGLRKLFVEVIAEQEGAVGMFEALGFQAEGLLRDHVRDREGRLHDLILLALPVEEHWAGLSTAGIDEALGG